MRVFLLVTKLAEPPDITKTRPDFHFLLDFLTESRYDHALPFRRLCMGHIKPSKAPEDILETLYRAPRWKAAVLSFVAGGVLALAVEGAEWLAHLPWSVSALL